MKKKTWIAIGAAAVAAAIVGGRLRDAAAHRPPPPILFEVTVTNITRGQVLSPPVVATHSARLEPLFVEGEPASSELAAIAEDAVNDGLIERLDADPAVKSVGVIKTEGGPIPPGKSASIVIEADRMARFVSLVGMLVTTNDAFFALKGVEGPAYGTETYFSPAYDAGTEENNEKCEFIPGPPCGKAGVRAVEGAEGYVHIHAGIHGEGDLVPAQHDWRNPVAEVTIRRVQREPAKDK